jgi:hypothetical protein
MLHLMYEVDDQPVAVEEGIHFTITDEGWIKWRGPGLQIPDGTVFTSNYEFRPVWVVTNHPHALRDTVTEFKEPSPTVTALPIQAAVKLDYLDTADAVLPTTEVV